VGPGGFAVVGGVAVLVHVEAVVARNEAADVPGDPDDVADLGDAQDAVDRGVG